MNFAIILSGGIGLRFNSKTPKQYLKLNGKEVIEYAINAFKKSELVDDIIVVAEERYIPHIESEYGVKAIKGGSTRNESLKNGLDYINKQGSCKKVIITEAARPMLSVDVVDLYLKKLDEYDAVTTGQKITDSLGSFKEHTVNRDDYYLIQAPEAFDFNMLYDSFDRDSKITATNQQMPKGYKLFVNFDFIDNIKITHAQDLAYCESLIKEKGQNYDI